MIQHLQDYSDFLTAVLQDFCCFCAGDFSVILAVGIWIFTYILLKALDL